MTTTADSSDGATQLMPASSAEVAPAELDPYYGITVEVDRERIREAKVRIQAAQRKTLDIILEIGDELLSLQPILGFRLYDWAYEQVGVESCTVDNYLAVVKRFKDNPENATVALLPLGAVYALATHVVPDVAVEEVVTRLKAGEQFKLPEVKAIISKHRASVDKKSTEGKAASHQVADESRVGPQSEIPSSKILVPEVSGSELDLGSAPTNETEPLHSEEQSAPAHAAVSPQSLTWLLASVLSERSEEFKTLEPAELSAAIEALEQLLATAKMAQR